MAELRLTYIHATEEELQQLRHEGFAVWLLNYVWLEGKCSMIGYSNLCGDQPKWSNHIQNIQLEDMHSQGKAIQRKLMMLDSLIRDVIDLVQTKKAELLASQPMNSDDDSTTASTNLCRHQINEMVEQLQNKDERIEELETQNATILAELADQKKTNNEIIDKMKRLFPDEFQ
ncbi:hypothetical protein DY000_02040534 [Brassica cretica]|uniref:Uncharacterized protein n=1 Tax=Brassica cretica TaxID=69181 RepID=A0ABQ7B5R0_BRACR|nr:hypothetical protein DY000_02040534 [Brassica cretica]